MGRNAVVVIAGAVLLAACSGDPTETATPREDDPVVEEADEPEHVGALEEQEEELAAREAELDEREAELTELAEELAEQQSELATEQQEEEEEGAEEADDAQPPEDAQEGDTEDMDVVVRLIETFEPDAAWDAISAANQYNEEPAEGEAFWMMTIEVTNQTDGTLTPWDFTWHAEGPEGIVYFEGCGVLPDPDLHDVAAIRPGGTQQGNICFEMREDDAYAEGERLVWADAYDEDFNDLDVGWGN